MASNAFQSALWYEHISLSTSASQNTIQSEPAYSFNRFLLDLIDSGVPICPPDEIKVTGFIGAGVTMSVSEGVWQKQLVAVKSFALFYGDNLESETTERLDFAEKLRSASLELRVMSLDSIKKCKNIANLLAGSWKNDPASARLIPSLVVELANYQHRTLQDTFSHIQAEELGLKSHLIWGIINGLRELHFNSILHGDLKPDNILLFQEDSNPYPVPKLSDFGFCQADPITDRAATGTEYWLPPECLLSADMEHFDTEELERARELWMKARYLPARDIYSFGLVAFSIIAGHPWFGVHRGPGYTAQSRAAMQSIKISGDMIKESARSLLKNNLRLVDGASKQIDPSFSEMPTPASLEQWRDLIRETSHSGQVEHVKDPKLTDFLSPYLGTCGGISPRNDGLNGDLQEQKLSWQIMTTNNQTWRPSTGIYPVEILYLPETLSLLPADRYQAVDWTEWLRPLSMEQEPEKHKLDPGDAFKKSHIFSTTFRGSKDLNGDYQHVVPQSMWPAAVAQLIKDADAPHSSSLEKYLVADCYFGGNGVEKDIDEGLHWILKEVDSAKTEQQAWAGRLSFIHLFSHLQDPQAKALIPTNTELEWTLEYLRCDGYRGPMLPVEKEEIEFPSLPENFTEKLKRDMNISLGEEAGFQLLRVLFSFGNAFGRVAVFPEPGYQNRSELVNHLLGGKDHLPALQRVLCNPGAAFEFFEIFDEKLLRQMAASSSGQTFYKMFQFSIDSIGIGGVKSFDALLGGCYTEDVIHFRCDLEEHEPHELLPVLFSAMANENWSTFHWLMSSGARKILIKSRWRLHSALFYAVMIRNPLFVTALLTLGADPNDGIRGPDGTLLITPLAAACAAATSIVPFVDEELEPSNCFFTESRGRFTSPVGGKDHDNMLRQRWIVQALATAEGIDINLSCFGTTALQAAVRTGDEVMVKILLDNGASTAITSDIVMLSMREPDNDLAILRLLVEHGADINGRNADGFTPLFTAVVVGLPNVVRVLLELGANPSLLEPRASYAPLHMAAEKCDKTIVRHLLAAGADREAQSDDGLKPIDCLKRISKLSETSITDAFLLFSLLLVVDDGEEDEEDKDQD